MPVPGEFRYSLHANLAGHAAIVNRVPGGHIIRVWLFWNDAQPYIKSVP
jgi:hypothetical protein